MRNILGTQSSVDRDDRGDWFIHLYAPNRDYVIGATPHWTYRLPGVMAREQVDAWILERAAEVAEHYDHMDRFGVEKARAPQIRRELDWNRD